MNDIKLNNLVPNILNPNPNPNPNSNLLSFINLLQETIVYDESRIILINGCAGSRKTDTIIKKGIWNLLKNKNILFLTFVSSVSDEIRTRVEQTLNIPIPKIGMSNHYLAQYNNNWIEIANIDAWIHKQLDWMESYIVSNELEILDNLLRKEKKKELSINFNNKVIKLKELVSKHNFYNIILKNNTYADVVLIDEFQDTSIEKVELIIAMVKSNLNLSCVIAGDILQTIFVDNIGSKKFVNPMLYFKQELNPKYYEINTCFRCPAPHINFVNYLLGEKYKLNNLGLIVSQNSDHINKPVLFGHDCISKNETAYYLALGISNSIITLLNLDPEIKLDDIAIIMKKSNSNYVFDHIKNILPLLLKINFESNNNNKNPKNNSDEQFIIHFETSGDGYSNTINWEKSTNKAVLVSIHGDKGKGHKVVFFIGLSRKSIPSDHNIGKDFEIFDISLLNVALTRSLKYLFVGFTFNSPSIYLSSKHKDLGSYCYLAWENNISPELKIYYDVIKQLNAHWFDKLDKSRQKPKFLTDDVPKLSIPIKTILHVRDDISKDLSMYLDKIVPSVCIEEDCIDMFESFDMLRIPDSFYRIFGYVGELLLMRFDMILSGNFKLFGWIEKIQIYYTNSNILLNVVSDYGLNKLAYDYGLWKEKLLEIELDQIIKSSQKNQLEKINSDNENNIRDLISQLDKSNEPVLVLNNYYSKFELDKLIKKFCSKSIDNQKLCENPILIIMLGLLYAELNSDVRKDYLYRMTDKVLSDIKTTFKIISQIQFNSKYVWENFLSGSNIQFQKNISIEKKLFDKKKLNEYGFRYKNERIVFKKGLKLSIGGVCDVYNETTNTLIEIKTCLKTSFSNEWVLQIIVYNLLLELGYGIKPTHNYIINLFDGSIYKINFIPHVQIIKTILEFYEFDDYLTTLLLT